MEKATVAQKSAILLVMGNSCFTPEERESIKARIGNYSPEKAKRVLAALVVKIIQRSGAQVDLRYYDYEVRILIKKKCQSLPKSRSMQPTLSASESP